MHLTANKNARTRLLTLVEVLTMYSDEQNILSIEEICGWLNDYGYDASRRTVLEDIKAINSTTIKIIAVSKPKKGYYIAKCYTQDAINLILEAIFSSDMLTEDDTEYIKKYLRANTCIPTLDLILNTTVNFNSRSPKREFSKDALHNLRLAIRDKKQVEISVWCATPDMTFSDSRETKKLVANPVTLAVASGKVALVFTQPKTPEKAEFINIPRIEEVNLLKNPSTDFKGDVRLAKNYFDNSPTKASCVVKDWIFIKFKAENLELVENHFSSPSQIRKDTQEGYYIAKVYTTIDDGLIGWLFTLSDRIEILAPSSLREMFVERARNILK